MESKKDIRKRVLNIRNLLEKEEWEEHSDKIMKAVAAHPFFLKADEIYCYVDFRKEVATKKLIEEAWKLSKKVAVPKIEDGTMNFYYIESMEELTTGYYGILEPKSKKAANGNQVLVIMPGSVFDKERNRIGYGKGYYDRYLAVHPDYHTIAIAFDFQVLDEIPTDAYDIKPEVLITEDKVYA